MTSTDSTTESKVELKYCEGCGSLCLRAVPPSLASNQSAPLAAEAIYCPSCAQLFTPRRSTGRKKDGGRP